MVSEQNIQILYDGNCPLCCNRVAHLKRLDKVGSLKFINFREDHKNLPVPEADLEKQIHAVLPDGKVINRMEVIREAYRITGHGWIMAPTGWPLLRPVFDLLYRFVARNRIWLSHFMTGN